MFSVLMSLYHRESPNNLRECLYSLTIQTTKASEVVIVYDGEISEELNCIVSFYKKELNIIVVKLPHNVGLGNALNHGLTYCSNRIIARMDTDDICKFDRFERQIKFFCDNKLDLLGSGIIEFDEYGNRRLKILPCTPERIFEFLKVKNPFNHMTIVFNKDVVEMVGGYKHHLYMEDYNLWIRVISAGYRIGKLEDILVEARVGKHTLERRRGWKYIKSELALMRLKNEFNITNKIEGGGIFLIRVLSRILPISILNFLYSKDRVKIS